MKVYSSTHPQASQIARAQTNRKIPWEYEDCGGGRFLFSHARRVSRLVGTSTMSRDETECAFAQIRCLICFPWPADRRSERHEVQKQFSGPYSRDLTAALWLPPGVSSESVTRLTTSHVIRDATGRSPRGRKGGRMSNFLHPRGVWHVAHSVNGWFRGRQRMIMSFDKPH